MRFLKNSTFLVEFKHGLLFKICPKFSSAHYFYIYSCKEDHTINMLRKFEQFITISLPDCSIPLNAPYLLTSLMHRGQQTFPVFNSMVVSTLPGNVLMNIAGIPLLIKCSNFLILSGSNLGLPLLLQA